MKQHSTPQNTGNNTVPAIKHEMALSDLLQAGTTGISKLTELPAYGETALPTTISELILERGFVICKERRDHIHQRGGKTFFTWYWLADQGEAQKAVTLVNHLRRRRFAQPLPEPLAADLVGQFPPAPGGVA